VHSEYRVCETIQNVRHLIRCLIQMPYSDVKSLVTCDMTHYVRHDSFIRVPRLTRMHAHAHSHAIARACTRTRVHAHTQCDTHRAMHTRNVTHIGQGDVTHIRQGDVTRITHIAQQTGPQHRAHTSRTHCAYLCVHTQYICVCTHIAQHIAQQTGSQYRAHISHTHCAHIAHICVCTHSIFVCAHTSRTRRATDRIASKRLHNTSVTHADR